MDETKKNLRAALTRRGGLKMSVILEEVNAMARIANNAERSNRARINLAEAERAFIAAMRDQRHLVLDRGIQADGRIHRCDAGNKPGSRGKNDGAYVLHLDGWPAGAFCNYTDGIGWRKWKYQGGPRLSASEYAELMAQTRAAQQRASRERYKQARATARRAVATWKAAVRPHSNNPGCDPLYVHLYLVKKSVQPYNIRQFEDSLVVPIYAPVEGRTNGEPNRELVNLQFIDADGAKRFMEGGRVSGCFYRIKAEPGRETGGMYKAGEDDGPTVCVCEGFATGASIRQATGHEVYVAFNANNLPAVARMIAERMVERRSGNDIERIVVCADDDWKTDGNPGITWAKKACVAAAAWRREPAVQVLLAVPKFGLARKDTDKDFNDLARRQDGLRTIREIIADARPPEREQRAEGREGEENSASEDRPMADKFDQLVDELAAIANELERDQKCREAAKVEKLSPATLRKAVEARRRQLARANEPEPEPPDVDKLADSAREIIECGDVLGLFAEDFAQAVAGEVNNAKLLYLVATSRLFAKPMHAAIKGSSAAGKSELRRQVLNFFPPEHIISFTALSEKALLYMADGFEHKILSMGEALNPEQFQFQDALLRQLMSERRLEYPVVMKQEDGTIVTVTVQKEGPVAFLVTTTRNELNFENETRVVSIEVDESETQTKRVLRKIAESHSGKQPLADELLQQWHDYQRWLAAGECRVYLPFAKVLARMIGSTTSIRLRRDFNQLLDAIAAHALLHRDQCKRSRRPETEGFVVATIADDYAAVAKLMAEFLATAAQVKVRKEVTAIVKAVKNLTAMRSSVGATSKQVAQKLHIDRSTANRRLAQASELGLLINLEERKGRAGRYVVQDEPPAESEVLPSPAELRVEYDHWRQQHRRIQEQNDQRQRKNQG
jgi:phage/plasmid primase-like uncharacterized protein